MSIQTPQATTAITPEQLHKWEQVFGDFLRRNGIDNKEGFQAFLEYRHLATEMDRTARNSQKKVGKMAKQPVVAFELTKSQTRAKAIMGSNFFGIQEAANHFGIRWTQEQYNFLDIIPFSEEVLEACKDTHVLVAGYPMTILNIRTKAKRGLFYSNEDAWYNGQAFANTTKVEVRWYLIRKTPVYNSTSKSWSEQQVLLIPEEETPTACVVVYTIIGHFLNTGQSLFENVWVRCSDIDSDGGRVYVGGFDSRGLYVYWYWGDDRYSRLGLSASRICSEL